jgi:hypothetical protein
LYRIMWYSGDPRYADRLWRSKIFTIYVIMRSFSSNVQPSKATPCSCHSLTSTSVLSHRLFFFSLDVSSPLLGRLASCRTHFEPSQKRQTTILFPTKVGGYAAVNDGPCPELERARNLPKRTHISLLNHNTSNPNSTFTF